MSLVGDKIAHVSILRGHEAPVTCISWSPNGEIATSSSDATIRIWNPTTGHHILAGRHLSGATALAWSPNGRFLASCSKDSTIRVFDSEVAEQVTSGFADEVTWLDWIDSDRLFMLTSTGIQTFRIGRTILGRPDLWTGFRILNIHAFACSPHSSRIAYADHKGRIGLASADYEILAPLEGHLGAVTQISWDNLGQRFASSSVDRTIRIWDGATGRLVAVLEGHTARVLSVAFSHDNRLLFSKSSDGTVRVWNAAEFTQVASILEPISSAWSLAKIAAHPTKPLLATYGKGNTRIRVSTYNSERLLSISPHTSISYASAKVVLVGESNAGKSCLALRLAGLPYQELGTTHGMKFWRVPGSQLAPNAAESGSREVVLWDLGGQVEYQLVHQLFLAGTTLALVLFDPTRGRDGFEQAEGWYRRLEKQLHGGNSRRLLIGSKLDSHSDLVDTTAVRRIVDQCGFEGYYPTSAKTGMGIQELAAAIYAALNWDAFATTTRPEAFDMIRQEISRRTEEREVVLLVDELRRAVASDLSTSFEDGTIEAVVDQLSLQGLIVRTRLDSGDEALLLQIGYLEAYAGAIIVAARDNPRGVPAIEERALLSSGMLFPGIIADERLPRSQERLVVECAVQLLLQHGICLKHEGVLIFPSLFNPTDRGNHDSLQHSVSLYYDFAGAIDNIYSALVTQLALSEEFGHVRLWDDRAEFADPGRPTCGIRKVGYGTGLAHLDIYFDEAAADETRELFTVYVEEHLRKNGLEISEIIEITCSCGFRFLEPTIRRRLAQGDVDIICPECEIRTRITEGAQKARRDKPTVERRLIALKTIIGNRSRRAISSWRRSVRRSSDALGDRLVRILHLSDLHIGADSDIHAMLQPLVSDMSDAEGGLGVHRLDALIVSGDLTNRASLEEFELARQFISKLMERLELSAERCMLVPGNHDVDWDEMVYDWRPRRSEERKLRAGQFVEEGRLIGIRNSDRYPDRFRRFSSALFHPLLQQEYPLKPELQVTSLLLQEERVQMVGFNSAWETDEFFPHRAGIHAGAVAYAIEHAKAQLESAGLKTSEVLRIAVWHHPVTGNEKIIDDAFTGILRKDGFAVCAHGHVHDSRQDILGFLHHSRLHVAGAGSFGAGARERPESTPALYNLLEFDPDSRMLRVHTRSRRVPGGAWEGWAVWPGDEPTERRTYYEVQT
jgi:small GTP-binding protein